MNTLIAMMIAGGLAQADDQPVLYRPGVSLTDQSLSVRSWGSGICSETEETAYEGATSIRVVTKNLFQGGALVFKKPASLDTAFKDKSNLLRLTFKTLDSTVSGGSGPGGGPGGKGAGGPLGGGGAPTGNLSGGFGGGAPQGGGGAPQGGGAPTGGFGAPGRGGEGGPGAPGGSSSTSSTLKSIRIIVTTTDGKKSEAIISTSAASSGERGWRQAGIPLQAIKGFDKTNKIIKDIAFSGDVSTAFYIGDMRILSDKTPIRAEPNFRNAVATTNDNIIFSANGFGGSSVLKYEWDFDETDGIQVDAEGQSVRYRFRIPSNDQAGGRVKPGGVYVVTLTVRDQYGLKEPYSTTIKVKIN